MVEKLLLSGSKVNQQHIPSEIHFLFFLFYPTHFVKMPRHLLASFLRNMQCVNEVFRFWTVTNVISWVGILAVCHLQGDLACHLTYTFKVVHISL